MHVLVTGGAGFIGHHLARRLVEHGATVRILDDFSTGSHANVERIGAPVEVIEGDVRDPATVARSVTGCDAVAHLAAQVSTQASIDIPLLTHDINVTATLRVLQAARDAGIQRVVFAASSAAYGNAEVMPVDESVFAPSVSPYGASKLAAEAYCSAATAVWGLTCVPLRFFNVYGPYSDPESPYAAVIPRFIAAALGGGTPTVYGDGLQTRDFVYVGDVAEAITLALGAEEDRIDGGPVNVATGRAVSLLDLLAVLSDIVGRALAPELAPARSGEIRHSRADVARAEAMLGFRARTSLEDGLRQTVAAEAS